VKTFDPLHARSVPTFYPFLNPPFLRALLTADWGAEFRAGGAKGPLKALVAETLPRELVYRPKSGFVAPLHQLFAAQPLQELFEKTVFAEANPLRRFFSEQVVRTLVHRSTRANGVGTGAYYFLWCLAFASQWSCHVETSRVSGTRPADERS
jgi:asparagine synthase (glutamine-hydrolysing)